MRTNRFIIILRTFTVSLVMILSVGLPSTAVFADDAPVTCVTSDTVSCPTDNTDPVTLTDATDPSSDNGTTTPSSSDQTTNAAIDNTVDSTAASGDANVTNNVQAGDATSGDAQVVVNQTNQVQTVSSLGAGTKTFVANVDGNVSGNFVIDPSSILNSTSGNTQVAPPLTTTQVNASIQNNITADATTGDAVVAGNVQAGDATSGDAQVVVNVMNIMNSIVASGQSFVGTININGNLNGDILLPSDTINQLLATNLPVSTDSSSSDISTTNTGTITNNVNSTTTSGQATVDGNINAGNATTGDASTNVTIFDLTNTQLAGSNVLLVFVNVQGQWVGLLMNAPAGSTAAEFGNGINTNNSLPDNSSLSSNSNLNITNNINTAAHSGDATVANNISGGDATTGRASTAVNILNLQNSSLSLANWFGILFINVFGTWHGNFGLLPPPAPATSSTGSTNTATAVATTPVPKATFARFIPHATADITPTPPTTNATLAKAVLGDTTDAAPTNHITSATIPGGTHIDPVLLITGGLIALCLLAIARRYTTGKN